MKIGKINLLAVLTIFIISTFVISPAYSQDDDSTRQILKTGLVGAGTGALASGMSGGKAGQGALIGAGTAVIGSALLDAITGPSTSSRRSPPPQGYYPAQQPAQGYTPAPQQDYYYADQPEEYYEAPPQGSGTQKVLKQGLVGAGTGALAAGMSGGKAGQGALIGAGTNIIGNALLDTITQPPQQRAGKVYRRLPPPQPQNVQIQDENTDEGRKRVIKKYDPTGKLVSEEEIYY